MKKIVKRIAAMGAAVMMMASMSAIGVNAYGTASFSNELAHSDDYNPITTTSGYSIDYAYGVWATSISSVSGYSKGTPRFKVKTGGYSDMLMYITLTSYIRLIHPCAEVIKPIMDMLRTRLQAANARCLVNSGLCKDNTSEEK